MPKKEAKTEPFAHKVLDFFRTALKFLLSLPFKAIFAVAFITPLKKVVDFAASWWRALIIIFAAAVFLYYPIGAYLINRVDDSPNPQITVEKGSSRTIAAFEYLIDREINEHLWTPNLPFFFPSYFLDNMPNFQLGMFSSLASFSQIFSSRVDKSAVNTIKGDLSKAAELLQYPGTIWMFSPENRLIPAPSSNSKYREALKFLRQYNSGLNRSIELFYPNEHDLQAFLRRAGYDLSKSSRELSEHIRENSQDWFDAKADDFFFYHKGRLYAYYIILSALGDDYQDIIVGNNLYEAWTYLIKALEQGSSLNPMIVRNAPLDSVNAPNHLLYQGFYALNAQNTILRINAILEKKEQ